jgi:hypothetical protein
MGRRRDDTFLLYYLEDFTEFDEDNPSGIYCLSDSSVQIILSALRFSTWPTRWRIDRDDLNRAIADEYVDKVKALGDLAIREVMEDMTCNFTEGLQLIADAMVASSNKTAIDALALQVGRLADRQCCDDLQIDVYGGVQGSITQASGEVVPIYGTEPPIGRETGTFPESFETLEAYNEHKCRLANQLVDGLLSTLLLWGSFGTYNALTLAGLILVSIPASLIFPPAAIPIAVSVLLIVSGSVFLLIQVRNAIEADKENWVCWLYEGENTEGVMQIIADALDVVLAAIPVGGKLAYALKTIVMVLMNSDNLNQLFTGAGIVADIDVDCSGCGEEPTCGQCLDRLDQYAVATSQYDVGGDWGVVNSSNEGSHHAVYFMVNTDSAKIEFRNLVGYTSPGWGNDYQLGQETQSDYYYGTNFAAFQALCETTCISAPATPNAQWSIVSSTSFTVEIRTSVCEP